MNDRMACDVRAKYDPFGKVDTSLVADDTVQDVLWKVEKDLEQECLMDGYMSGEPMRRRTGRFYEEADPDHPIKQTDRWTDVVYHGGGRTIVHTRPDTPEEGNGYRVDLGVIDAGGNQYGLAFIWTWTLERAVQIASRVGNLLDA